MKFIVSSLFIVIISLGTIKAASDTVLTKSNFGLKGDVVSFKEKKYSADLLLDKKEPERTPVTLITHHSHLA